MVDKDLKLETKCYDANEYGYLYGICFCQRKYL